MSLLSTLAAFVLALVFFWSGVSKLAQPAVTRSSFEELGLPVFVARVVPFIELCAAGLLIVDAGWGGVLGFALLAAFTTTLVSVLRSGKSISCGCFGGSDEKPIRGRDVARNVGLLALAACAAGGS